LLNVSNQLHRSRRIITNIRDYPGASVLIIIHGEDTGQGRWKTILAAKGQERCDGFIALWEMEV